MSGAAPSRPPRLVAAPLALPASLAALALVVALLAVGTGPPAPRGADAPVDEFSAARAFAVLERILAEQVPHRVGTPENFVVRDRILHELEALGYEPEVQRAFACRGPSCAPVENIVARLPGAAEDAGAVMLASHYDSRGAGPGAADAGSGYAAILEVARIIRLEAPYHHPVVLLVTDGEEVGLLGAEAFVREHPWAADVRVAINLEARGSAGPSVMFETSADNRWLVRAWSRSAPRPVANSLMYDVYRRLPNDTDATVFARAGMAVLNFAFLDELVHYHSRLDDLQHLDLRSLQHHGDNALAAVRALAGSPMQPQPGDATYLDVFGMTVIGWPATLTLPLAVLFAIVIGMVTVVLVYRRVLGAARLGWAVLAVVAALVASLAAGWLASRLVGAAVGPFGLHAYPWLFEAGLWALALLVVLAVATPFARLADALSLLLAPWLLLSIATVVLAAVMPGAAVILVVPQAAAAVLLLVAAVGAHGAVWRGRGDGDALSRSMVVDVAAVLVAVAAGFTLLQLARMLQVTFVLQMPIAITVAVTLAALPLMPLVVVAAAGGRVRAAVLSLAAVAALVAWAAALAVPAWSESRPQPLNIAYLADGQRGAWWAVQAVRGRDDVPEPLRSAGGFDETLDWLPGGAALPARRTAALDVAGPRLETLAVERHGDARAIQARLHAAQAGNRVLVILPAAARLMVEGVTVAGRRLADSRVAVMLHGVPAEGLGLRLEVTGPDPLPVVLHDHTPGLPEPGAALVAARPRTAAPSGDGDVTIVRSLFVLE